MDGSWEDVCKQWKQMPEDKLASIEHVCQRDVKRTYPHAKVTFITNRRGERTNVGIFNAPLDLNHKLNFDSRKQASPQLLGRLFDYSDSYHDVAKQRIICEAWVTVAIECIYGGSHEKTWELSRDGIQR